MTSMLEAVVQHGTGRAAALDGFAAGKTGTSQDYRDAWFIGFNDALVVGVWVGNDDRAPMDRFSEAPGSPWNQTTRHRPDMFLPGTPGAKGTPLNPSGR